MLDRRRFGRNAVRFHAGLRNGVGAPWDHQLGNRERLRTLCGRVGQTVSRIPKRTETTGLLDSTARTVGRRVSDHARGRTAIASMARDHNHGIQRVMSRGGCQKVGTSMAQPMNSVARTIGTGFHVHVTCTRRMPHLMDWIMQR